MKLSKRVGAFFVAILAMLTMTSLSSPAQAVTTTVYYAGQSNNLYVLCNPEGWYIQAGGGYAKDAQRPVRIGYVRFGVNYMRQAPGSPGYYESQVLDANDQGGGSTSQYPITLNNQTTSGTRSGMVDNGLSSTIFLNQINYVVAGGLWAQFFDGLSGTNGYNTPQNYAYPGKSLLAYHNGVGKVDKVNYYRNSQGSYGPSVWGYNTSLPAQHAMNQWIPTAQNPTVQIHYSAMVDKAYDPGHPELYHFWCSKVLNGQP